MDYIYENIVIGDGPVGRILHSQLLASRSESLKIDAGVGLKLLTNKIFVDSNINYTAKHKAPSLNKSASDYFWAGGCQGWPKEDLDVNEINSLPLGDLTSRFFELEESVAKTLRIKNFDFKDDVPIIRFNNKNNSDNSTSKIYAKVLTDPHMMKINKFSSKFKNSTLSDIVVTRIFAHKNYVMILGFDALNFSEKQFRCRRLHLCLGTIENTRLLMNSSKELNLTGNQYLGKFLSDHLSLQFGTYSTGNLASVIREHARIKTFDGFRIWPRIKLQPSTEHDRGRSFAHIDQFNFSGSIPKRYKLARKAGYENLFYSSRQSGSFDLNLFLEKSNEAGNKIFIENKSEVDIPQLNIEFNLSETELIQVNKLGYEYESVLRQKLPDMSRVPGSAGTEFKLQREIHAGSHPSGTYRMSKMSDQGVVNRKSELWTDSRIRVLGAGVFPRASATHPTFPSMVLALLGMESK